MKVTTRLALGSGSVLLLLFGVLAYQVYEVQTLANLGRSLARTGLEASRMSLEQVHELEQFEQATRKFFVTGDPDYGKLARSLALGISNRQQKLEQLGLARSEKARVEHLGELWRQTEAILISGQASRDESTILAPLGKAQDEARAVFNATQDSIAGQAARAERAALKAQWVSLLAAVLALAASAAVLLVTFRSIRDPLKRLTGATRELAEGRFDLSIEAGGGDEFAQLAGDFNAMVRRLGELDQMKKNLLSHVSHDLKTPLAAMQETNQLMLEGIPGPTTDEQRRLLEMNLQSARRLSAMIAKLLDLARLEAGVMDYDLKTRDMVPLLREALEGVSLRAGERGVPLRADLPEYPLRARCDADRLFQVLENLLENAVKFSPENGVVVLAASVVQGLPADAPPEIRARTATGGDFALVTVSDEGPGVPDEHKRKIFERFHQVDRGRRPSEGGVGLGLAICSEIVGAHEGYLWVRDNPGGGSVFCFALRAVPQRPEEGGEAAGEGS